MLPSIRHHPTLLVLILFFLSVYSIAAPCRSEDPFGCEQNANAFDSCCGRDSRKDCGYSGISKKQCESRGCCWSPSYGDNGIPWCFRKNCENPSKAVCSPYGSRIDCGFYGIGENECEGKGCCWSPLEKDSVDPWCYYKNADVGECCDAGEDRSDCGYLGIKQKECESRGCCWSPLEKDSKEPWCFFKNSDDCKSKEKPQSSEAPIKESTAGPPKSTPEPEAISSEPAASPEEAKNTEELFYEAMTGSASARELDSAYGRSSAIDWASVNKKKRSKPKKGGSKPKVEETKLQTATMKTKKEKEGSSTEKIAASFESKSSEAKEKGPGGKKTVKTETAAETIVRSGEKHQHGGSKQAAQCIVFDKEQCGPDKITKEACLKKGCCWDKDLFGMDPDCYYKDDFAVV